MRSAKPKRVISLEAERRARKEAEGLQAAIVEARNSVDSNLRLAEEYRACTRWSALQLASEARNRFRRLAEIHEEWAQKDRDRLQALDVAGELLEHLREQQANPSN